MATLPRSDFETASQPMIDPSVNRIDELIRLQKSAQRITSTLNLDEIIDRIVDEVSESLGCVEIGSAICTSARRASCHFAGVRGCTTHGKGHHFKVGPQLERQGMSGHVASTRGMRSATSIRSGSCIPMSMGKN